MNSQKDYHQNLKKQYMKHYIKTPTLVEAIQWTGENLTEIELFCNDNNIPMAITKDYNLSVGDKTISEYKKGDNVMDVSVNDYIVTTEEGHINVFSSDNFESLHTEIQEVEFENFGDAEFHKFAHKQMPVKSLHNTTANGARKNVKDIQFWGNGDTFKLISKASSENEGWMKSTKALEIEGLGCVVQTTTQQRNPDGSYALTDAVTFVPNAKIEVEKDEAGDIISRKLISNQ